MFEVLLCNKRVIAQIMIILHGGIFIALGSSSKIILGIILTNICVITLQYKYHFKVCFRPFLFRLHNLRRM
jgi:hypothetical protein